MRQYERNIDKVVPIRNFGTINGQPVKFCRLKKIANIEGMCYFVQLLSESKEILGARWITRHMYRYHVMQKPY